jgi:hypothetical protein
MVVSTGPSGAVTIPAPVRPEFPRYCPQYAASDGVGVHDGENETDTEGDELLVTEAVDEGSS